MAGTVRNYVFHSALRSPELSAQLRRPNSSTSCRKGYCERSASVRCRKGLWCAEDGGRGVCSSDVHYLVQKPVSVAQMQFTHATRSPRARQTAGRVVCGSKVDIVGGISARDSAAMEKSFL